MFIVWEIQQLILNTDSCMIYMTFPCSTFKIFYHHGGDHMACGKTK